MYENQQSEVYKAFQCHRLSLLVHTVDMQVHQYEAYQMK